MDQELASRMVTHWYKWCEADGCDNIKDRECLVYVAPYYQWRPHPFKPDGIRACPMSHMARKRACKEAWEKEKASRMRNRPGQQKQRKD